MALIFCRGVSVLFDCHRSSLINYSHTFMKADIVKSLEEYNRDIEALRQKMDAATVGARAIRDDITDLKNK